MGQLVVEAHVAQPCIGSRGVFVCVYLVRLVYRETKGTTEKVFVFFL